jgi:UDP-2,3-diacylglucosamine hydrolase
MIQEIPDDGRSIVFVGDAHLGAATGRPDREERLIELVRSLRGTAAALFVMGDLFDFWFEYRHAVPKGTFRIARALADLLDSGVSIAYFGGNHDFWVGSYLREELGLSVFQEPVVLRLQNRLVYLAHGDGLGRGDNGYKLLKRILRAPWAIAGYRAIHPDLGIPLARRVSGYSRKHTEAREVLLGRLLRDVVRPRVRGEVTAMVMGHVHEPAHMSANGRDFVLLGDWMDNMTHARLERGRFTLYQLDGTTHRPLATEPFPPEPDPDSRRPGEDR